MVRVRAGNGQILTRSTKALARIKVLLKCTDPMFTKVITGSNISGLSSDLDSGTSLPISASQRATIVVTLRGRYQLLVLIVKR